MLGWRILNEGEYRVSLPRLSEAEEELILKVEHALKERTREVEAREPAAAREMLRRIIVEQARERRVYLDERQQEYLPRVAAAHIYGLAFLEDLLQDDTLEEIAVIGLDKPAYVYRRGEGWKSVNAAFRSDKALTEVINKMAQRIGRRITLQNPRLDAVLEDGSRLHASLPPLSQGELTIRRFRQRPYSPIELERTHTLSPGALALLSLVMQGDGTLVIAGNTASGKTTLLNALFSFVPMDERVLIGEETPEINIPHPHQIRLVASRELGVPLRELVYDSLRMRPDRTIVGEVRNQEEVEALFDIIHGGQARGTYATLHAQSAAEAVKRLQRFGVEDIASVDWLLIQRRMRRFRKNKYEEVRRLSELVHPRSKERLLSYDPYSDDWQEKVSSGMLEAIGSPLGMRPREVRAQLQERRQWMKKLPLAFGDCFAAIQRKVYGLEAKPRLETGSERETEPVSEADGYGDAL